MARAGDPKRVVGGVILLLLMAALVSAVRGALDRRPAILWRANFAEAQAEARRTGRPLMAVFEAPWCGWCARMERQSLRDPSVVRLSRRFVCVRVDADRSPGIVLQYGGIAIPYTAFVAPDGAKMAAMEGFVEGDELARAMTDVLEAGTSRQIDVGGQSRKSANAGR